MIPLILGETHPVLGLKHFKNEGCLSYLIFDRKQRQAALIDPHLDLMDDYRSYLSDLGLTLQFVLETHTHADHFSASHLLRSQLGCEIGMSAKTESERPTLRLKHQQKIPVGSLQLEVLETPGHTPDSISFWIHDASVSLVFTGDTLLIGSTGRTDFPGADAGQQWDSLHKVIGALPGSTLIYPGHDYSDFLFSTLDIEKKQNPQFSLEPREQFIALKKEECITTSSEDVKARIHFNRQKSPVEVPHQGPGGGTACGAAIGGSERVAAINVEKYAHKLEEQAKGILYLDVREPDEYGEGHMPGAENLPLSEIGLRWASLQTAKRIYISCLSGRRSSFAAKTLTYLGHPDVINVTGGFKAWTQAGLPVE